VTFQDWVKRLIAEKFRNPSDLAQALGMHLTPLTRGIEAGTFNLVNLLRLAKIANANPSTVLRMAQKGDEADLIESLYGKPTLDPDDHDIIALWHAISDPDHRNAVRIVMGRLAAVNGGESAAKRRLRELASEEPQALPHPERGVREHRPRTRGAATGRKHTTGPTAKNND